jgi:hypothetical protein
VPPHHGQHAVEAAGALGCGHPSSDEVSVPACLMLCYTAAAAAAARSDALSCSERTNWT